MTDAALDLDSRADLAALRAAAAAREWSAAQMSLARLIQGLPFFAALAAIVEGFTAFLPTFQQDYPPSDPLSGLPNQILLGVMNYGFAPERLPDEAMAEYDAPGAAQFILAVLELARAAQKEREPLERIELLVSAAANQIVATLSESYYRRFPEDHARVRANQYDPETGDYSDPDAARIPILLWLDPTVSELDTHLWSALADRLERAYLSENR
jgi:hypothetical protein